MIKGKIKVAILGASGYTGLEIIRLLINSKNYSISEVTADSKAGMKMSEVYPHLRNYDLPRLKKIDEINLTGIDAIVSCLPHSKSQNVISSIPKHIKVVDLSADFRFKNTDIYEKTYNTKHEAKGLQKEVVYGLSEINRNEISKSRVVANPGCYPTSALLPLIPVIKNNLINTDNIIIDSKSGVSGAGRTHKDFLLFGEVSDGFMAYGVSNHRHKPEINFQIEEFANSLVNVSFTPHLLPIKRGILSTIYFKIDSSHNIKNIITCLKDSYSKEPFINIHDNYIPSTHDVRGTNSCSIGISFDNTSNTCILVSVIDNLIKGASGQALQNLNLMFGIEETDGLINVPMFI